MRTKQEVINFLESKLGTTVPCIGNSDLDGECVTLIKALMEFLGVQNPYKARGHAKDCIATYLNEGIADPGTGFLSVFSNKNMGVSNGVAYGHVWCNAGDGAGTYYEQNGQQAKTVTKGTTYSRDNVCNFDKYITENSDSNESESEDNMSDEYGDMVYKSTQFDEIIKEMFGEDKNPRDYSSKKVIDEVAKLEKKISDYEENENSENNDEGIADKATFEALLVEHRKKNDETGSRLIRKEKNENGEIVQEHSFSPKKEE